MGVCARAALRIALRACLTGRGHPLLRRIMTGNAIESIPAGVFDEIAGLQTLYECVRVAWHAAPRAAWGSGAAMGAYVLETLAQRVRLRVRLRSHRASPAQSSRRPTNLHAWTRRNAGTSLGTESTPSLWARSTSISSRPFGTCASAHRAAQSGSPWVQGPKTLARRATMGRAHPRTASDARLAPTDFAHPNKMHALARAEESVGTRSRVRSRRRLRSAPASPAASSPRIACPAGRRGIARPDSVSRNPTAR